MKLEMKNKGIPDELKNKALQRFQRLLWSISPEKIDFKKDYVYIIHQILSWGELEDLKLLFKIYGLDKVKQIFLSYPKRVYTYPAFCFAKILLGVKAEESKYVAHII